MTGDELRDVRTSLRWNQQEMADYLHLASKSQVSRMESGERKIKWVEEQMILQLIDGRGKTGPYRMALDDEV